MHWTRYLPRGAREETARGLPCLHAQSERWILTGCRLGGRGAAGGWQCVFERFSGALSESEPEYEAVAVEFVRSRKERTRLCLQRLGLSFRDLTKARDMPSRG